MKLGTIGVGGFILHLLLIGIGAYKKITHAVGADTWLIISLVVTLVFISAAIYEVRTSTRINQFEKTIWTAAFIFFGTITALIYILAGRKRIAENFNGNELT